MWLEGSTLLVQYPWGCFTIASKVAPDYLAKQLWRRGYCCLVLLDIFMRYSTSYTRALINLFSNDMLQTIISQGQMCMFAVYNFYCYHPPVFSKVLHERSNLCPCYNAKASQRTAFVDIELWNEKSVWQGSAEELERPVEELSHKMMPLRRQGYSYQNRQHLKRKVSVRN